MNTKYDWYLAYPWSLQVSNSMYFPENSNPRIEEPTEMQLLLTPRRLIPTYKSTFTVNTFCQIFCPFFLGDGFVWYLLHMSANTSRPVEMHK